MSAHVPLSRRWTSGLPWLLCILIVVGLFAIFYGVYGHSGLPIGWDTPRYVSQMSHILRKGVLSFIQGNDYYNVGYAIFSSPLTIAGPSPFAIEILLPISLCVFIVVMAGIFVKGLLRDRELAIYTAILATSWFAVYRLGADLHPNLLTLALLLPASYFFLGTFGKKQTKRGRLWFFLLLISASFTHVETTGFFTCVLAISAVWLHRSDPAKYTLKGMLTDILLMFLATLPSVVLYAQHMKNLLSYTAGVLVSYPLLSPEQWITSLSIAFPAAIFGFYLALRNALAGQNSPYTVFISSWGMASVAIASAHYILPAIQIFSERALILFPVPFATSAGLKAILERIESPKSSELSASRQLKGVLVISLILGPSLFFTCLQAVVSCRVWISPSAYERLTWLSRYYRPEMPPIFIFNDYDQYAGGLGDLNNNWVQAIYGDHYSYLGDINLLLRLSETPFTSTPSQEFSAIFLEKMTRDGIFAVSRITQHNIILVTDFYLPRPLPAYDRPLFDEIRQGIFVINYTKCQQRQSLLVPLYSRITMETSNAGWYSVEREWAKSVYALEFWSEKPSKNCASDFLIPITEPGNYSFLLRYWDGEGSGSITVKIDDYVLGEISYSATHQPANFTANIELASSGVFTLRIVPEFAVGQSQYASLDYLEISMNE